MFMMYLYCVEQEKKDYLINKGFKLLNIIKGSEFDTYVFELNHELPSSEFSFDKVKISDKLMMTF